MKKALPPFFFSLGLLVIWEIIIQRNWVESYLLPAPTSILKASLENRELLTAALLHTMECSIAGLLLAVTAGTLFGLLFARLPILRKTFYPFAILFQTVPVIAVAPLLVIWFGYGKSSVIVSSFIVSLFPMLAASIEAFRAVPNEEKDLFRIFGASKLNTFFKLDLPSALPNLLTGCRISSGLAVIGAIVGEFMSGQGIGSVVDVAKTQYRTDLVFSAILLSTAYGILVFLAIEGLTRYFIGHWHSSRK